MKRNETILLVFACIASIGSLFGQSHPGARTPREYYDIIGNRNYNQAEQAAAFTQLERYAQPKAEARYWLAEAFISGRTGEGGPIYARNVRGFPPNRPQAYNLAIPLLVESANENYVPALTKLADLFYEGKYVDRNLDKTLTYLTSLVKSGDSAALEKLKKFYSNDLVKTSDKNQQSVATELLAQNGFVAAQIDLSKSLIAQNTHEALENAKSMLTPLSQSGNSVAATSLDQIKAQESESAEKLKKTTEQEALRVAALQEQQAKEAAAEKERNERSDLIITLTTLSLLVALVLSIPGAILGFKDKLIIYHGNADLNMTCFIVILGVVTVVSFYYYLWLGSLLLLIEICLVGFSIRKTYMANRTAMKTILVVPTKFILLGLIALCGLVAIGGAISGIQALEKKNKKEAVRNLVASAGGVFGYIYLKRLIGKLVKEDAMQR